MNNLIKLGLTLAEGVAAAHVRRSIIRTAYVAFFGMTAIGCAIAGFSCGLAALWMFVIPYVGTIGAPLVVAGVLFAMCFTMLMLARHALRLRHASSGDARRKVILVESIEFFKEHKTATVLGALAAGLAAGKTMN